LHPAAILVAVLAIVYFRGTSTSDGPEMRLEIDTPVTNDPRSFALSPDGRQVAYVATEGGQSRLWVRQLRARKWICWPQDVRTAECFPFELHADCRY
jgi:hypothetical protein